MSPIAHARVHATQVNYRTDIIADGHALVADEAVGHGGQGAGASPFDLVLSGLGACTSITLRMYAQRKGWDLGGLVVDLTLFMDRDGNARIERTLRGSDSLTAEQWQRLLAIAEKTPVTLLVKHGGSVETRKG